MQGPSNLSNACTSMTAKNRSEKKIVYQKGHHKKSTFWSQNTDLQSNPFASEAPTEATQTNPIFDFSLSCCLEKQDYRNTHLTYTHHVGTNRSPGSCDKQSLYKKLMLKSGVLVQVPPFKGHRPYKQGKQSLLGSYPHPPETKGLSGRQWCFSNLIMETHSRPMLLASSIWPQGTKILARFQIAVLSGVVHKTKTRRE